jgi:hypothetical protein
MLASDSPRPYRAAIELHSVRGIFPFSFVPRIRASFQARVYDLRLHHIRRHPSLASLGTHAENLRFPSASRGGVRMMQHQSIRIGPLTFNEVEAVMVSIWCALETHNLESPHLASRFASDGRISIEFTFKTPGDAALVARAIDRFCPRAPLTKRSSPQETMSSS